MVKEKTEGLKNSGSGNIFKKIDDYLLKISGVPLKEKLFFVQHLRIMLHSGISILTAFRTLSEQTENKTFSKILKAIANKLESGTSLTEALKDYPAVFGELFINMVASGEISGKLEEVFSQLFLQMKKQHELTSKIKGALTYPVIVIIIMIGIAIFMMMYVVPKILNIFKETGAELPLPTRIMINISNFLINNGTMVLIAVAAAIFLLTRAWKTEKGKFFFQSVFLKIPIISGIIKKINLARFARTASSLLKTDIMIIEAFRITANVLGNLNYRYVVLEIGQAIKKGGQISEVIKKYPVFFPPLVTQMIIIGEQTGEIDNILDELAKFYEDEVNQTMENLPSILEPLLILILGVGVGGMAIAIILPMYSISSAI